MRWNSSGSTNRQTASSTPAMQANASTTSPTVRKCFLCFFGLPKLLHHLFGRKSHYNKFFFLCI